MFDKLVPAWASDLNLLAQVVKLQYMDVRQKYLTEHPSEKKLAISGNLHPISFSWCFWDQRSKLAASSEKQVHQ
jgi:hypothetical protein